MTLNNFFTYMILVILFYPIILFYIAVIVVIYLGILKPIFNKNKSKKNGKI
jgi:type II secretory pathway component PulF